MVQILPYVPSFGEKLASSFGQAAGQIGKGYFERRDRENDSKIIDEFERSANGLKPLTPAQKASQAAAESTSEKPSDFGKYIQSYERKYGKEAAKIRGNEYSAEKKADRERNEKMSEEKRERAKQYKKYSKNLENLEKNKEYAGNIVWGPLNRTAVRKKAEIDSEAINLEGFFRDRYTKGQMSAQVFEELLKKIPNSKDSEAVYQGKIDGIRSTLQAEYGDAEDFIDGKQSNELTDDVIDQFLEQAQGDVQKAEKLASEAGYKW